MRILLILMCFSILGICGCSKTIKNTTQSPIPKETLENQPQQKTQGENMANTPTPQPKISSDFENAPNAELVSQETGMEISAVLLQDILVYTIPMSGYFAIALEEDAEKSYRWLLASEDGAFEYIEESHINGYRVFILKPIIAGEASILFELTQDSTISIEILSYQIVFS